MTTHLHHNPPRHRAGNHKNVVEVSITCHAMFHFCEWQLYGHWEDKLAWRALSGMIKGEDIIKEAQHYGGKKGGAMSSIKGYKRSEENRLNSIKGAKGRKRPPAFTEEHRRNLKEAKIKQTWGDLSPEEIKAEKARMKKEHLQKPEVKARRAETRKARNQANREVYLQKRKDAYRRKKSA